MRRADHRPRLQSHPCRAILALLMISAGRLLSAAEQATWQSHLLPRPGTSLDVRPGPSGLTLIPSVGDRLTDCRPYVAWRFAGQAKWSEDRLEAAASQTSDPNRFSLAATTGPLRAEIVIQRTARDTWEFSGTLHNAGDRPIELARFHFLHGTAPQTLALLRDFGGLVRHGQRLKPYRQSLEELWASMSVRWPRLADPIHDTPDWAITLDAGGLISNWSSPAWFFGFVGPGTAFGEIGLQTTASSPTFYLGVLLDNILLDSGQSRPLEQAIARFGDIQDSQSLWASECARRHEKPRVPQPMVGYCSWYQYYSGVRPKHILRAAEEFAQWPIPPGGRLVQIDDGFQRLPGDWRPNDRFTASWADLPKAIRKTGSVPGVWLAPIMVHQTWSVLKTHPDWIQRLPDKSSAISFSNWGVQTPQGNIRATHPLEIDRPDVRAWMGDLFRDVVAQGWQYIKIDFIYPVCTARVAYDRKKTSFQTLRDAFALFREACGPKVLLNACIGEPGRYAIGYADYARLGGDVASQWGSVKTELRSLLMKSCTNGQWWVGDFDTFYMRRENSKLSPEESYLQTGSIGLAGGLFLTSDYPTQWSPEAQQSVREFWNDVGPRVPAASYALYGDDGTPQAYRASYASGPAPRHQVGIYNWDDKPQTVRMALKAVGLRPDVSWRLTDASKNKGIRLQDAVLIVENQPPHSLRIAGLDAP